MWTISKASTNTYGHAAGDDVLQNLAQKCGEQLRSFDVMARYGGDEFILMLRRRKRRKPADGRTAAPVIESNSAGNRQRPAAGHHQFWGLPRWPKKTRSTWMN